MKPFMADGNAYALRAYEAKMERNELKAPSQEELENFIYSWMEEKRDKMGFEFISEALTNNTDIWEIEIFKSYGKSFDFGYTMKGAIDAYYRPLALKAALEHDFERDRRENASEYCGE